MHMHVYNYYECRNICFTYTVHSVYYFHILHSLIIFLNFHHIQSSSSSYASHAGTGPKILGVWANCIQWSLGSCSHRHSIKMALLVRMTGILGGGALPLYTLLGEGARLYIYICPHICIFSTYMFMKKTSGGARQAIPHVTVTGV